MGLVAGTLVEHHSFMVLPLRKYPKKHIGAKKNKKIIFLSYLKFRFLILIKKNIIIIKLNTSTTAIPIDIEIGIANNINGNTLLLK